nr:PD-(D/E)XK motif protein [Promicromonospora soli]
MAPSSGTRVRVHELEQETAWGPVALAVDTEGFHHVLVPILSSSRVRTGLRGPGLALRKRTLEGEESHTTYADLSCLRHELDDLFDRVCSEVLTRLVGLEQKPLGAVYNVIDRWQSLFDSPIGILSDQKASGLYGELLVLRRLLQNDTSAHRTWVGPLGEHHDFKGGSLDIEVKATTFTEGRFVQIHGLDQLEEPVDGDLLLAWFRLVDTSSSGKGVTLLDLAQQVIALADDGPALRALLARAAYVPGVNEANDSHRYVVADERWYDVDEVFPRLTRSALDRASVPETVTDVTYAVDLTAEPPVPLGATAVDQRLEALVSGLA